MTPPRLPLSRADAWALAGLLLLALIFFWPVTTGLGWLPHGGGDLVSFLWPTYSYAAQALRAGRLPLWNHSLYSGAPLVADNQSGLFYPINLLVFLLWPGLPYLALEALVIFHVWLAGAGAYLLLRVLLAQSDAPAPHWARAGACVAGTAYMFSDVYVTHVGNLNILAVAAWLPWVLLLLEHGLTRRSVGCCAAAGAALGVAALAGHAQLTLIVGAAAAAYGLWRVAAALRRRDWRASAQLAALGLLAVLVAFGLAALSLLPALELTTYTVRARLDYAVAAEYSLPWQGLAGLVSPLLFGRGAAAAWGSWPRVELGYAGLAALFLAGLAPLRSRPGWPRFLLALGLFGWLVALGANTPLHRALYTFVPGFASLRVPARFVLLPDFALAGLAGYGLARLPLLPRRRVLGWALALAALGAAVLLGAWLSVPGHAAHLPELRAALLTAGLLLAAALALTGLRHLRLAPAFLAALVAADVMALGAWVEVDRSDPTLGYAHPAVVAFLRSQPGPLRIDNAASAWAPDAAARLGLEDIGGVSNPLGLAAYATYAGAVGSRGSPLYNFLNAQFVLADKGAPPGDAGFVPVFNEDPALDVYLNTRAQPRVRLVTAVQVVTSGEAAFGALHAPGFNPEQAVILDSTSATVPPPPAGPAASAAPTVFYTAYAPEASAVVVRTAAPAYLVYSEVWYPGWRAWVDGVEAPIYRANFAFRAVAVPVGEHTISMRFDPPAWRAGLALTALTLLALAAWGAWAWRARRATREDS
ncbi:MAG: YfhO family protein [Anaerolineales bacterium]|nr:YfhO family protein [Anaerolineales bacterium]